MSSGGGDWAQDRIVPDCVRAWSAGIEVELRNISSTRPWQHVLEPISGYLQLAATLSRDSSINGEAFNFGPREQEEYTVLDLVKAFENRLPGFKWVDMCKHNQSYDTHESRLLRLNCDKARHHLGWHAVLGFEETVDLTAEWYRSYYEGTSRITEMTLRQISDYISIGERKGLRWAS